MRTRELQASIDEIIAETFFLVCPCALNGLGSHFDFSIVLRQSKSDFGGLRFISAKIVLSELNFSIHLKFLANKTVYQKPLQQI